MRGERPWRTNRARALRANATSAEDKLWEELRGRRLGNYKFVRQAPIGSYYADFLCRERKLVVEVDGATHSEPADVAADKRREADLLRLGYKVVRVSNQDVFENIDGVVEFLLAHLAGGELEP